RYQLNIPKEPLDSALRDFAHQTGLQIARFSDAVDGGALVGPIAGELSAHQALTSLLAPSGLTYKVVNDRTIAVVSLEDKTKLEKVGETTSSTSTGTRARAQSADGSSAAPVRQHRSFWSRFRLAQGAQADGQAAEKDQPAEKKPEEGKLA